MDLTKWRIIIGNMLFTIAVGYFYFRPDAPLSFRIIVFILLVGVLIVGTINEIRLRLNSPKSNSKSSKKILSLTREPNCD